MSLTSWLKPTLAGLAWFALAAAPLAQTTPAQTTTVPAPAPVQSAPLAPPAASETPPAAAPTAQPPVQPAAPAPETAPATPAPQPPAPLSVPPPAAAVDPNATLAGKPGDPNDVDEVAMPAKPALVISGQGQWDRAFETLSTVFNRLAADAERRGLKVAGRPLTIFTETDDIAFRFEAMLPVDRAIEVGSGDIRPGVTPSGRAMRFMHRGPYEDIDSTYEGITAYLDAKGLTVRDQFIEEYLNQPKDAADPSFEINIYVQPR